MPSKDIFHDSVVIALQKASWHITHDPLHLRYGKTHGVKLIIYDPETQGIIEWIK